MTRPFLLLLSVIAIITTVAIIFHPAFCGLFAIPLITLIIDGIACDFSNIFCGLLYLFRIKRIHTLHGRFYIIIKNNDYIGLYHDKLVYLQHVNSKYFSDVEHLKVWVKKEVDQIYHTKVAKSRVKNELKMWNGYVDKQTEREKKLTDIL